MHIQCASDFKSDSCERSNQIGCAFDAYCGVHVNCPKEKEWLYKWILQSLCYANYFTGWVVLLITRQKVRDKWIKLSDESVNTTKYA